MSSEPQHSPHSPRFHHSGEAHGAHAGKVLVMVREENNAADNNAQVAAAPDGAHAAVAGPAGTPPLPTAVPAPAQAGA